MKNAADARIPVFFGLSAKAGEAVWLVEAGLESPAQCHAEHFTQPQARVGHAGGCNCCTPRGPAADALTRLFRARATGAAPFFQRVIVLASATGEAAVREALAGDVVTAARYYLADAGHEARRFSGG